MLPVVKPWIGWGFSYQKRSPSLSCLNWKARIQEKEGPNNAPGSRRSDNPPANRSMSSGCLCQKRIHKSSHTLDIIMTNKWMYIQCNIDLGNEFLFVLFCPHFEFIRKKNLPHKNDKSLMCSICLQTLIILHINIFDVFNLGKYVMLYLAFKLRVNFLSFLCHSQTNFHVFYFIIFLYHYEKYNCHSRSSW